MVKEYWERLRELREDRDIKQYTIAGILNTNQQMYSRYENGRVPLPIHHLKALCEFYRVSADYILGLTNNPEIGPDLPKKR